MNDHLVVGRIDMKDKWFIIVLTVVLFIGIIGFHKLDNKYEAIKKANTELKCALEIANAQFIEERHDRVDFITKSLEVILYMPSEEVKDSAHDNLIGYIKTHVETCIADTEMLIKIAKKFENETISNVLREALNAYEETL